MSIPRFEKTNWHSEISKQPEALAICPIRVLAYGVLYGLAVWNMKTFYYLAFK